MSGSLSGRRIVVAGGAQGIGRATVARFLNEGASVAVIDRDDARPDDPGGTLPYAVADITDSAAIDHALNRLADDLGGLDGLVNCVGLDLLAPLENITDEDWDRLIAVNLTGAMKLCRAALPHLRRSENGATIVNLSSAAGLVPLKGRSAYAASKAGLQMFSKSLAMELAPDGIRVNTICPGAVDTALFRSSIDAHGDTEAQLESARNRYALNRIASPEEIASAILWLSSAESSYVTGVALAVDGGRSFH
ncbi:SDR family NAD(P)-dependent oxidoreductase [Paracoccus sp. SCSIO 75233]|uniref:SDR family NAD(P)-dependent oxidoreductase n=1 Tax=Paracoccus sp. SCSIO 75233 TaxID=3017782 RepID=UPI0022EFE5D3|nr:SDR family oxidoreductase [Paracoccus sp. SCSIO 75233]WBU52854.1 SDR family NAD(P)-dependent oxidoreductase [Paracoccus sp. SCSIO 75233]